MKINRISTLIAVGAAVVLSGATMAQEAKPGKHDEAPGHTKQPGEHAAKPKDGEKTGEKGKGIDIGAPAPNFTLKDTEGKEHTLAEITKSGKVVVLFWFNPDCPFVVKHYKDSKTFNDLATKYKDKGVEVLAINSGAPGNEGSGLARNQKAKKDWNIPHAILMDESGTTGKAYGAKNTPFTVVIDKAGAIAYMGAIDDDAKPGKPGATNYAAKAVDEILAGTNVTTPKTKPYGCSVKY